VSPERPEKYEVPPAPRHVTRADSSALDEAAKERRAKRGRRLRFKRRLTMTEWIGFGASCVACALLLPALFHAGSDMRHQRVQVREKQAQFAALDRQKNEEKNRLAHLKSEAGRDQLLAERGYVAPGTRILLFPEDQKNSEDAP
jgi:cell division protein FtsB